MDYLEKIFDFVDGTLDATNEQILFDELAKNEELRSELKQQMVVSNAVRKDFVAYNPSADSTLKIFSQLGFTTATTATTATMSAVSSMTFKTKVMSMLTNYSQGLMTFLATSTLATVAFFMLNDENVGNNIVNKFGGNGSGSSYSKQIEPNNNNFTNNSGNNTNSLTSQTDTTIKTEIIYKDRIIYKNDENSKQEIAKLKNRYQSEIKELKDKIEELENQHNEELSEVKEIVTQEIEEQYEEKYKFQFQNLYFSNVMPSFNERVVIQRELVSNVVDYNFPILSDESLNFSNTSDNSFGINIETGWSQYFSSYNELVNPGDGYQDFNNLRIAALYDFNSEISMGLDYRRENFYLIFNKTNEIGQSYKAETNPNFQTINAIIRYKPESLRYFGFSPFIQAGVGANVGGEVGRFMVGTEYNVNNAYKFIIGTDYNLLNFKDDKGLKYTSNKTGFQMGFGLKF